MAYLQEEKVALDQEHSVCSLTEEEGRRNPQASDRTNHTASMLLVPYMIVEQGRKIDLREAVDSQEYVVPFAFKLALGHRNAFRPQRALR